MSVVKGRPPLRIWELNSNSTRYDQLVAAPSDATLHFMWSVWAGIALSVGLFASIIFFSILLSRKTRRNSFNVYLLYTMLPDIIFSVCCGITCLLNAVYGEYWSHWMCNFQQFYCIFGIGSSAWLNALITHQLHKMMRFSQKRRRYKPPSRRTITFHSLAVYSFMAFLGTWGLYEKESFPFHAGAPSGLACIPIEVNPRCSIFFWLCFIPIFVGAPVVYVLWVFYDVQRNNLLPPTGKRRILAVYFGRLVLVFLIMWLPTFIILFIAGTWLPPWAHWAGGTWSHLQGAVSAALSMLKPDILKAVQNFVHCKTESYSQEEGQQESNMLSSNSTPSFRRGSLGRFASASLTRIWSGTVSSELHSPGECDTAHSLRPDRKEATSKRQVEFAEPEQHPESSDDSTDDHSTKESNDLSTQIHPGEVAFAGHAASTTAEEGLTTDTDVSSSQETV